MHSTGWTWDTTQNRDIFAIRLLREPFKPKDYGWTDFGNKLRRACAIWEEIAPVAFTVAKGELDPTKVIPMGTVYISVLERPDLGRWAWVDPHIEWDFETNASSDIEKAAYLRINVAPDRTPPDSKMEALLTHELGHVLGLHHETTKGVKSVMRFDISSPLPSEHDAELLRELYG